MEDDVSDPDHLRIQPPRPANAAVAAEVAMGDRDFLAGERVFCHKLAAGAERLGRPGKRGMAVAFHDLDETTLLCLTDEVGFVELPPQRLGRQVA